jgi:hypothetical protein
MSKLEQLSLSKSFFFNPPFFVEAKLLISLTELLLFPFVLFLQGFTAGFNSGLFPTDHTLSLQTTYLSDRVDG